MSKPWAYKPHQVEFGAKVLEALRAFGFVYLQGGMRSGKSMTALNALDNSKAKSYFITAPRGAIDGWHDTIINMGGKLIEGVKGKAVYRAYNGDIIGVSTYSLITNFNPDSYGAIIIDEAHNLGAFPKRNHNSKKVRAFANNLPKIELSGTPMAESPAQMFHQFSMGKYSPFQHASFYKWHREFGVPYSKNIGARSIIMYDHVKWENVLESIYYKYTIVMTQEDAGISKDLQAIDVEHYVELEPKTIERIKALKSDKFIRIREVTTAEGMPLDVVADSTMAERIYMHMIEQGVIKVDGIDYILHNDEKINYILDKFGDSEDVGIMCNFVAERKKLKQYFKHAKIYSSTSKAEGVDLSFLKHFIILSSNYSGVKFIQRRERTVNVEGSNTLEVHHILTKGAISEAVYKTVSQKLDFNNEVYNRVELFKD